MLTQQTAPDAHEYLILNRALANLAKKAGLAQEESGPSPLERRELIARQMNREIANAVGELLGCLIKGAKTRKEVLQLTKLEFVQSWLNTPETVTNEQNVGRIFALIKDICQGPKKNVISSFFSKTPESVGEFNAYLGGSVVLKSLGLSEKTKGIEVNSAALKCIKAVDALVNPIDAALSVSAAQS